MFNYCFITTSHNPVTRFENNPCYIMLYILIYVKYVWGFINTRRNMRKVYFNRGKLFYEINYGFFLTLQELQKLV